MRKYTNPRKGESHKGPDVGQIGSTMLVCTGKMEKIRTAYGRSASRVDIRHVVRLMPERPIQSRIYIDRERNALLCTVRAM